MDNVGIVVEDLEAALDFFRELGLELEGAPVNARGYLRVMFALDDIDETLDRLRNREGLLIGLAQELS